MWLRQFFICLRLLFLLLCAWRWIVLKSKLSHYACGAKLSSTKLNQAKQQRAVWSHGGQGSKTWTSQPEPCPMGVQTNQWDIIKARAQQAKLKQSPKGANSETGPEGAYPSLEKPQEAEWNHIGSQGGWAEGSQLEPQPMWRLRLAICL